MRAAVLGMASVLVVSTAGGCGARSGVGSWSEPDDRAGSAGQSETAGAGGLTGAGGVAGGLGESGGSAGSGGMISGGGAGTGGAGALGGAGAAGSGGAAGSPCGPLIDDMEDGDGRICEGDGRYGAWYAFNDATGTQWPAPTAPGSPIEDDALAVPRGGSTRAMHTRGEGFTGWGAGIGLDFAFDGTTYSSYAAGYYDGIAFWARSAAPIELDVRISSQQTALAQYGGTCEREPCAPHFRRVALTEEWREYRVAFNDIPRGRNSAHLARFLRGALLNLQFMPAYVVAPFEFWIDDVAFYRERNCCTAPPAGCEREIVIPDPALAARVREVVGKPSGPLLCDDVCNVSPLDAALVTEPQPISDLTGLGCMTGLTELSLSNNQVDDLRPLVSLGNLQVLNLVSNQLVDISPLAKLSELRVVELWNNQIADISPLAALPQLESASLYANRIADISPLAGAAWLGSIDLGGNRIADATPLAAAHPESLRLAYNQITDVGQFLAFDRLTYADLTGNPIPCETEAAELALLRQRVSVLGACD